MMEDTFQNFSLDKLAMVNITGSQNLVHTQILLCEDIVKLQNLLIHS